MAEYGADFQAQWSFSTPIATTDGTVSLVAAPGAGRQLVVQVITICITTSAAQTFTLRDSAASPTTVFSAPASLAVGTYGIDCGPLGVSLTTNTALQFVPAAAGVGATISGFGYIRDL